MSTAMPMAASNTRSNSEIGMRVQKGWAAEVSSNEASVPTVDEPAVALPLPPVRAPARENSTGDMRISPIQIAVVTLSAAEAAANVDAGRSSPRPTAAKLRLPPV